MSNIRFYFSGNIDSQGNLGILDATDNIEEFYPRDYLENLNIPIIGINKELKVGYKFSDECFNYELIEMDNIKGWELQYKEGVSKFKCKSMEFGYPVISLYYCFWGYNSANLDVSNMDTSNVINMSNMFCDCNSLTSLDVSNFDTSKVWNMFFMFRQCKKLTSLDLSNFDTSSVTDMSNMFCDCNSLTSLDVSNFNTSNVTDMSYMFCGCNLNSLDLSNFDTSKVTDIFEMFLDSKIGFLICKSKLISDEARLNNFIITLVPETVKGITFDKKIRISKNIDLKALYSKLKFTGLTGKTIGYKEV